MTDRAFNSAAINFAALHVVPEYFAAKTFTVHSSPVLHVVTEIIGSLIAATAVMLADDVRSAVKVSERDCELGAWLKEDVVRFCLMSATATRALGALRTIAERHMKRSAR